MPVVFRRISTPTVEIIYTSLDEVKKVLRTMAQRRIRFSESIRNLQSDSKNHGTIKLSEVNMASDFAGTDRLVEVLFSNSTSFEVMMTAIETRSQFSVGSGTVDVDFESSGHEFVIPKTGWTGTAQAGDKVSFQTDSHISEDDVCYFVQRAEITIDSAIGEMGGAYIDLGLVNQRIFTASTVPPNIRTATTYLTAYLIWVVVNAGATAKTEDSDIPSSISFLKKQAETLVKQWFAREIQRQAIHVPRYISRMPLFTVEGILGEGRGLLFAKKDPTIQMPIDQDFVDREVDQFGGGEEIRKGNWPRE